MKILRVTSFLLFNLIVLKMFETSARDKGNNPEELPADVSNLPGGGTASGEVTNEGGDTGSVSQVGTTPADRKSNAMPQTPAAHDTPGEAGWSATGTPGAGGEIGEAARQRK